MISILFYGVSIIISLYILGYGLTLLVTHPTLRPYAVWLMPWFTIIFLIFSLVLLSLAGISVSEAPPFLIGFLLALDIYVVIKTSIRPSIVWRDALMTGAVMGVVFILALLPLLRHDKILTTISMGNNDPAIYAVTSDYLRDHSIKEYFSNTANPLKPGEMGVGNLIISGFRWGNTD